MSFLSKWRRRLTIRERLLSSARKSKNPAKIRWRLAQVNQAQRIIKRRLSDNRWGGSRAITNKAIDIVGRRAPVTSRKRSRRDPLSLANPGSDHSAQNRTADAVDFAISNAFGLADEISRKLGGPRDIKDFGSFTCQNRGRKYRVQIIAGTHGTGPHLHVGVSLL